MRSTIDKKNDSGQNVEGMETGHRVKNGTLRTVRRTEGCDPPLHAHHAGQEGHTQQDRDCQAGDGLTAVAVFHRDFSPVGKKRGDQQYRSHRHAQDTG